MPRLFRGRHAFYFALRHDMPDYAFIFPHLRARLTPPDLLRYLLRHAFVFRYATPSGRNRPRRRYLSHATLDVINVYSRRRQQSFADICLQRACPVSAAAGRLFSC